MNDEKYYSLTHPQKRIWYTDKLYSGTPVNIIGGVSRTTDEIDFKIFAKAINIFIRSHDGLRLSFSESNGEVKQAVSEFREINIEMLFGHCRMLILH